MALVLFNKKNKEKTLPFSYRPICMLSTWGKVPDKLITQHLQFYLYRDYVEKPIWFYSMERNGQHKFKIKRQDSLK